MVGGPSSDLPGAAMLADILAGESPADGDCPSAIVVIPGNEKGDRLVGSPGVKVPVGSSSSTAWVGSARGASNSTGCSASEPYGPEIGSPSEADGGSVGKCRALQEGVKASVVDEGLGICSRRSPGVIEDDMSRQSEQRKHGTSCRSPRPTGTAKALRITGNSGKSRCARKRGGWGRLSVDGAGQNNPNRSEGPWGRATHVARTAARYRACVFDSERRAHTATGCASDRCKLGDATRERRSGRHCLKAGLEAVLGKTRRTEF
jgi:hypothetical protein